MRFYKHVHPHASAKGKKTGQLELHGPMNRSGLNKPFWLVLQTLTQLCGYKILMVTRRLCSEAFSAVFLDFILFFSFKLFFLFILILGLSLGSQCQLFDLNIHEASSSLALRLRPQALLIDVCNASHRNLESREMHEISSTVRDGKLQSARSFERNGFLTHERFLAWRGSGRGSNVVQSETKHGPSKALLQRRCEDLLSVRRMNSHTAFRKWSDSRVSSFP